MQGLNYGNAMNMGKLWIEVLGKYRDIIPEFDRFIDIHLKPRVRVIRVNRLRIDPDRLARRLSRYNIRLEKVGWFDTAFIVREGVDKIGRTLEYHLGLYYIMDLVSLIPILIINRFRPRMVLDISAAPGGKALALAENMVGEGVVIANDPDRVRLKALIANIDRMGYPNIIVTSIDGRRYPRIRGVDCVLFDAPCSNESHITSIPEDDLSRMYLSGSVYRAYSRLQADIHGISDDPLRFKRVICADGVDYFSTLTRNFIYPLQDIGL